jgi:hypothetical protein
MNLVTPKVGAKQELLFDKPAAEELGKPYLDTNRVVVFMN